MWENMHLSVSSNIRISLNETGKVKGISSNAGYGNMKELKSGYPRLLCRYCWIAKSLLFRQEAYPICIWNDDLYCCIL